MRKEEGNLELVGRRRRWRGSGNGRAGELSGRPPWAEREGGSQIGLVELPSSFLTGVRPPPTNADREQIGD